MIHDDETEALLKRAMADPSSEYDAPETVIGDSRLTRGQKLQILERWETDARLLQVATEENMGAEDDDDALLQRVHRAITRLGGTPYAASSPAKSG